MLLDTPVADFGWKAPEFQLADAHGEHFSLAEFTAGQPFLLMFICNHCPYVKRIATQLAKDTQQMQALGIKVLAVMSNDYHDYPADAPDKMIEFAQSHGFQFPYLVDEQQAVAKKYGAVCTPDFFGFNARGELQYRGRFDNEGMQILSEHDQNRTPELLNAMQLIAQTGQGPKQQTPSMGCSIKWRNEQ